MLSTYTMHYAPVHLFIFYMPIASVCFVV